MTPGSARTFLLSLSLLVPSATAWVAGAPQFLPLKAVGTRILNSKNEPVILRGVNTASLEWTSDGEGHILDTVKTAIRDWKVNHIRLPLSQDRWFGKAPEQKDGGKSYRALVRKIVDYCDAHACYVMLDLHWSNTGTWGKEIGQHAMPDRLSAEFWKDCAAKYKNHRAVILDLYNEPHDVSWDVWLNGGTVTENDRQRRYTSTFEAVGMQELLNIVRRTGARNLVVAGGLDWAYDMTGFLEGKQLKDPGGNGVLYANHNYPFKGDTHEKWVAKMKKAAAQVPFIVSEFGGGGRRRGPDTGDPWVRKVLQALTKNNWHWTAWDLHPSAGPTLISDWNYTPTSSFGIWVKRALLGTLPPYTEADAAAAAAESARAAGPAVILPNVSADVLEKGIRALGDGEALGKARGLAWSADTMRTFNGSESPGRSRVITAGLDYLRQEYEGQFGGSAVRAVTVVAADRGFRTFGGNRTDLTGSQLAGEKRSLLLTVAPVLLLPLKNPGIKLESVPDAAVEGRPAAGIRVSPSEGKPFYLYFDKETGLPVRLAAAVPGFGGEDVEQETLFSDYRETGGIRKAMRVVVKRDGQPFMAQRLTEFRTLAEVDVSAFTQAP